MRRWSRRRCSRRPAQPCSACSAGADDLRGQQPGQRLAVGVALGVGHVGGDGVGRGRVVTQRLDHLDQGRRLEEDQPAVAVVVGQGTEALGPDRHLRVHLVGLPGVEGRPPRIVAGHTSMVTSMTAAPEDGPPGTPVRPGPGEPPGPGTAGLRLRPDPGLRTLGGGSVLLGGSPYRLLRLGPAGQAHVARWWAGEPVAGSPGAQALARRLLATGIALPVTVPAPSGGPGPEDVTVVIPVRDRTAELALCLRGLRSGQVLVVDDGSRDPAAVAAVAAGAGADYLHRPANGGPAAARNTRLAA